MIDRLPANALIIGGYSEGPEVLAGLTDAVSRPHEGLVRDADFMTARELRNDPYRYPLHELLVITHSAGIVPLPEAAQVIAINAPEPISLFRQALGAMTVTQDPKHIEFEEQLAEGCESFKFAARELAKDKFNPWIQFAIRDFSTARRLGLGIMDFPGGRMIVQAEDDGFGFTRPEALQYAKAAGVDTLIIPGRHNEVLFRPQTAVSHIKNAIERQN